MAAVRSSSSHMRLALLFDEPGLARVVRIGVCTLENPIRCQIQRGVCLMELENEGCSKKGARPAWIRQAKRRNRGFVSGH